MNLTNKQFYLLAIALIIIIGLAAYANSLTGKLLWDDNFLIEQNTRIRDLNNIDRIFTEDTGAGHGVKHYFYRPLQIMTYMLIYTAGDLNPLIYHSISLIFHIGVALCFFWLVIILFKDRTLALLTALLYVAHPIHTEAVAYISGLADPLGGFFLLLTLILYLKHTEKQNKILLVTLIITYILGLLTRENCLILPLLILVINFSCNKKLEKKGFVSILTTAVIYILLRFTLLEHTINPNTTIYTLSERLPGTFTAIFNYFRLLIYPVNLHMEYGHPLFKFLQLAAIAGLIISVILLTIALCLRKINHIVTLGILWFFILLLPHLNIYPINAYMAEHWLYLASFGFFLIVALGFRKLIRLKHTKILSIIAFIILLTGYSSLTIKQNTIWHDPFTFFRYTIKYAPKSWKLYDQLAAEYARIDLIDKAVDTLIVASTLIADTNAGSYTSLGELTANSGRHDKAIELYEKAITIDPDNVTTYINLGNSYLITGNKEGAKKCYLEVIRREPLSVMGHFNLGNTYIALGDIDNAKAEYEEVISIDPQYVNALNNLGNIYKMKGESDKAIEYYEQTISLNPDDAKGYFNLGTIYYSNKKYDKAISNLVIVTALEPRHAKAYYLLSLIYLDQNKYKLALKKYTKAKSLGIKDPALEHKLKEQNI